jgi:hypothetical protein
MTMNGTVSTAPGVAPTVAVIVAVPLPSAWTSPDSVTVATRGSLEA